MSKPTVLNNPVEQRFRALASTWKAAASSSVSSSLRDSLSHPAYREIIAMGEPAIPFILSELEREPDWWFAALKQITGVDPVPPAIRGQIQEMARYWLQWGRAQGYHW
jgi:hypothetical protein